MREVEEEGLLALVVIEPVDGPLRESVRKFFVRVAGRFPAFLSQRGGKTGARTIQVVEFEPGTLVRGDTERVVRIESDDPVVLGNEMGKLTYVGETPEVIETKFERSGPEIAIVVGSENVVPSPHTRLSEAEVPFADAGGRVALVLEEIGESVSVRIYEQGVVRPDRRTAEPGPPGVATSEEIVARRGTDRTRRVGCGELAPLRRENVDIRAAHLRRSVATQVSVAEIIRKNEEHIRSLGSDYGRPEAHDKQGEEGPFHLLEE